VDIQHASSLQEGLAKFVQGEMLSGSNAYHCGTCDAKVDTFKRTVIKELPPTLVLHLKRFEFDFDVMRKKKLNGRFPFPAVLDMRPYTVEGVVQAEELQKQMHKELGKRPQGEGEPTTASGTPNGTSESGGQGQGTDSGVPLMYELVGVLVHFGQAERGHYYSFIKEADKQGHNSPSSSPLRALLKICISNSLIILPPPNITHDQLR
jgi:uncharacterized UBP type Zn finger protein